MLKPNRSASVCVCAVLMAMLTVIFSIVWAAGFCEWAFEVTNGCRCRLLGSRILRVDVPLPNPNPNPNPNCRLLGKRTLSMHIPLDGTSIQSYRQTHNRNPNPKTFLNPTVNEIASLALAPTFSANPCLNT